jgi:hypothetical protein
MVIRRIHIRRWILLALFLYAGIREGYLFLQRMAMDHLDYDVTFIPALKSIEPEPPIQPGLSGIWIMGPKIKTLSFEIDPYYPGSRMLKWSQLPPNTRVRFHCRVNEWGYLNPETYDISGYRAAGTLILHTLQTWKYKNLMTGSIDFDFALPSTQERLTITTDLERKPSIPDSLQIFQGLLYNIEGLDENYVRIKAL